MTRINHWTDQEGDLGAGHQPLLRPQLLAGAGAVHGDAGPPPPALGGSPPLASDKLLPPALRTLGQGPLEHVLRCVYNRGLRRSRGILSS